MSNGEPKPLSSTAVRLISLPGRKPLIIRGRPESECPSCRRTMTWHKGRGCYICLPCNQPE